MYRLETLLFALAMLPIIMAGIFSAAVAPQRKKNLQESMSPATRPASGTGDDGVIERFVADGIRRAAADFDSLNSYRLLLPALIVSVLYWIGFSFGVSMLLRPGSTSLLCRPFLLFDPRWLGNPVFAVIGAYVFNTGILVRRAFMADITKNIMWGSINRVVLSLGFAIFLYVLDIKTGDLTLRSGFLLSFAIPFFPRIFITVLRRKATELLGTDDTCPELSLQLISGIDVWKEERLEEEGIESVQNMATADIFGLLPKLHYPVRTIVDWIDQAIFIQRFSTSFRKLSAAGFPVSAIEYAAIGSNGNLGSSAFVTRMAQVSEIDRAVLEEAITSLGQDAAVQVLWRLWQTGSINN